MLDSQNILVYVYEEHLDEFGFTFFDISTLKFYIGNFTDDSMLTKFRTLVSRVRPVEVICDSSLKTSDMTRMLQLSPIVPVFNFISSERSLTLSQSEELIELLLERNNEGLPDIVEEIMAEESNCPLAVQSLARAIDYLEKLLLAESILPLADFLKYDHASPLNVLNKQMIIDSQALQNLEVFEVNNKNGKTVKGSLFEYLNRTSTKFGGRMLRNWTMAPLYDAQQIIDRHEAVDWLTLHPKVIENWQNKMKGVPDLEKLLTRIYKFSLEADSKAMYINSTSLLRMNEFYTLLTNLEKKKKKLGLIFPIKTKIKSNRLTALKTFINPKIKKKNKSANPFTWESDREDEYKSPDDIVLKRSGLLPDIRPQIEKFMSVIIWKKVGKQSIPEPKPGLDEVFDAANAKIENIYEQFELLLERTN